MKFTSIKQIRKEHPGEALVIEFRRTCTECDLDKSLVYYLDPHEKWGRKFFLALSDSKRHYRRQLLEAHREHEHAAKANLVIQQNEFWKVIG